MTEMRRLWIPGPAGRLEAALRVARPERALAVFAHPHPLHGGTLHNAVVFHAERVVHELGVTTLRFNFRGAGESTGEHDGGRGEVDDLAAAVAWLRGLGSGATMLVVGYSFGAWCAVREAAHDDAVRGVIAIGLTVRIYDLAAPITRLGRPLAVVQADGDEFGTPDEVRAALAGADPPAALHVVAGTTHLFPGRARDVAARVAAAAAAMLPAAP